MAVFEIADEITGGHEGGYANNPCDAGGETYKGVARKFWGGINAIWDAVDDAKYKLGIAPKFGTVEYQKYARELNRMLANDGSLQVAIKKFYRAQFWDANNLDLVTSQPVANWIYDHAVNGGARGVKWAQEAAGVTADGQIGPKSIAAINAMQPEAFLEAAKKVAGAYRMEKIRKDPSQRQFARSWLSRDGFTPEEIKSMLA